MDMMYEYEGHDGWWGDSDEDGLDAKQFALNWPEFQKMKRIVPCTMKRMPAGSKHWKIKNHKSKIINLILVWQKNFSLELKRLSTKV